MKLTKKKANEIVPVFVRLRRDPLEANRRASINHGHGPSNQGAATFANENMAIILTTRWTRHRLEAFVDNLQNPPEEGE